LPSFAAPAQIMAQPESRFKQALPDLSVPPA
jgi:hypothetical protein